MNSNPENSESTSTSSEGSSGLLGAPHGSPELGPQTWRIGTLVYTRRGLVGLVAWLLCGDFAWQMRERAVSMIAALVLQSFGATDALVGLLLGSIPAGLGLLLSPIVNTKSDRHRGRFGRRIPFLLAPAPFSVAALAGLAFIPALAGHMRLILGVHAPSVVASRLIVFAALWTVFEVTAVITNGIFNALINDVVPHELIGRFIGVFRVVSLGAGFIFNFWIIAHAEQHYQALFIGLAILYGAGILLMCLKVKEGSYPPPPQAENAHTNKQLAAVLAFLRETFANPYYRWVYAAITVAGLDAAPFNAFNIFNAKSLGLSMITYGKVNALGAVIALLLSFTVGSLADRFHPLRVVTVFTALYTLFSLSIGYFVTTPLMFCIATLLHGVLAVSQNTVMLATIQVLLPKAKFGEYSAALGVIAAIVGIFFNPIVGALLDATGHDYRCTFFAGGAIGATGVILLIVVHKKFMQLGGPQGYIAPESGGAG